MKLLCLILVVSSLSGWLLAAHYRHKAAEDHKRLHIIAKYFASCLRGRL